MRAQLSVAASGLGSLLLCSGEAFVLFAHKGFAVAALEPAHGEMTSSHVLKVLDERVVHGGAAECADDRKSLCRDLLRHHNAKAGRHLCDEANENWPALLDDPALRDEARGLRHALRQHSAHREIPA